MSSKEKRFKLICTSVLMIVLAASTSQLSTMIISNRNVDSIVYAYSNSQAQSLANGCGDNDADSTNCANNGPLIQGDGSASSPIVTQSAGRQPGSQGEQGPPGPPGPDKKIQTRIVESEVQTIQPEMSPIVTATCASDEVATGGGYSVREADFEPDNLINYEVHEPEPGQKATDWQVDFRNLGPSPITVTVSAVCAKLVDAP